MQDIMLEKMKIFTIGFTGKPAETFFEILKLNGVTRIIDIRLNNTSQLASFARNVHLPYLLKEIGNIDYIHMQELAPTKEMIDTFKKSKNWDGYASAFISMLQEKNIILERDFFMNGCLLCSESSPMRCHRSLVAQYLKNKWEYVEIEHL